MKVLHLPTPVGGNAYGLSRAERALGLQSDTLYRAGNWLNYPGDIQLSQSRSEPTVFLKSVLASLHIPQRYDILHFNFGSTLVDSLRHNVNHWDLPLYKKQKLVVTYNGCDARQRSVRIQQAEICACRHDGCYDGVCLNAGLDQRRRLRITQFENAGASFFALNPDLMYVLPKQTRFLPYTIAGWDSIAATPILCDPKKLTIVHAPTDRVCKGSDALIPAMQVLQKKYPDRLQFVLVEKMPHNEALKLYQQADLVIDQLRAGWYGALAVEAMKMGKPVAVYINPDDLHFIPPNMGKDCHEAFIELNEFNLESILSLYIEEPKLLLQKREAALSYVHRWHDPLLIAAITKEVYEELL